MKLTNLIKIAPMVLMVFTLSAEARGDEYIKKGLPRQTEPMEAIDEDPVFRIVVNVTAGQLNLAPVLIAESNLESWMFNDEYLELEESSEQVEEWMTEPGYLEAESQPVEGWMFEASYLDQSSDSPVEPWMMDAGYLAH